MSTEAYPPPLEPEMPEASPRSVPPASVAPAYVPQAGRFYRVDSSRGSFVELWRDTRSPMVLFAWLSKLLRIKLPGSVNDPNVASLHPFQVADEAVEETIPLSVLQKFEPVVRELTDLGFGPPVYFFIDDRFHNSRTVQAAMLHRDGRCVARISHRVEGFQGTKTHFFTEFLSAFTCGTFLWSSSARAQLLAPPACRLNWKPKASTSQLWVSHRQAMDSAAASGEFILSIHGRDEMLGVLERHHEAVRDFQLQRGLFSSMQGEDLAQAEVLDKNLEKAGQRQMRYPEIMTHLDRLQKKKTSWVNAVVVLIVSVGLFIAAMRGAWKWSWEMLAMIGGVLFVHEAGHYLAMKIFRYRNVRMFFIPFFGAAVSGQHYNAPGWKKVIVSLMGPLPGIFLGGALGIAGMIKGSQAMIQVALMAVILNGLQLLPVLPLDGGRVVHAILFSRNHWLDAVFHALGAAALIGIGILAGEKVLLYLGIFMLIGLPVAYKAAKIVVELRRQGFGPAAGSGAAAWPRPDGLMPACAPGGPSVTMARPSADPAGQVPILPRAVAAPIPAAVPLTAPTPSVPTAEEHSVPQFVAEVIIDRVRALFPRLKSPKQAAELTLRVYETLATRPPGVAASIGFVFLHLTSFLAALVLLAVLLVGLHGGFGGESVKLAHSVDPDDIAVWRGVPDSPAVSRSQTPPSTRPGEVGPRKRETIVATFSTAEAARTAFDDLKRRAPAPELMVLFGETVLVSPRPLDKAGREKLFTRLEGRAKDVFADGGPFGVRFALTCVGASASDTDAIERELENYFDSGEVLALIPPWSDDDRRTTQERARHESARATYRKLGRILPRASPESKALRERIDRAARRNDQAEYERLLAEQAELNWQLRLKELKRIRDDAESANDRDLVERYIAIQVTERAADEAAESTAGSATSQPASNPARSVPSPEDLEAESQEDEEFDFWSYSSRRRTELGPLMGQLPLPPDGSRPPLWAARYSASGFFNRDGETEFRMALSFEDATQGAPAVVKWLKTRQCRNFKYEFTSDAGQYDGFE